MKSWRAPFATVVGIGALVACGQTIVVPKEPEKCKLQIIDLTLMGSPRINPTENGDARPVQVRVYQLATDIRLNNADFFKIWKEDKATLQDDLVKVDELTVYPDSRQDIHFERDEKALFVGAVALFRNPSGRTWYTVFELPPAPGKGDCRTKDCDGGADCEDARRNPHFYVWIDGTRVDDGSDRLDDYPRPGRRRDGGFDVAGERP